jgi:hypothetical protein
MRAPLGVLALALWLSVPPSATAEESTGRMIKAKNALVVAALEVRQARCEGEAAQGFLHQIELAVEIAEIQQGKNRIAGSVGEDGLPRSRRGSRELASGSGRA